mmetsp:Transcript_1279/g.2541  ORF Transcript_1279/g.2541 Transcript_1279/m.2541 type:complete len:242 (-) Transcript_1279:772-1497(-)
MRRTVHGHHPGRDQERRAEERRRRADSAGDLRRAGRLRDRSVPRQAGPLGRRSQSLQAPESLRQIGYRTGEIQHHADRPDGVRQDTAGADSGADPRCAVHDGRCDDTDRSRLRRRGCGEHHSQAVAGLRIQRRTRAARHRLYRRGRQDHPQVRQPLHHPRRFGRGGAAGASEDHGRHRRLRAAAGRAQASAAGVSSGRYHEYPVHLWRRLRRARQDHRAAGQGFRHGLRRRCARSRGEIGG